jgi:REP element-mobilizing transposase RayT
LPSFREQVLARALTGAIAAAKKSPATGASFRIVHFSIQKNHLHLMVEAQDRSFLSRGMLGLAARLARALNREPHAKGRVWGERYHARDLKTPREVRNAIVYVLMKAKKDGARLRGLEPCSSAPCDGAADVAGDDRLASPWAHRGERTSVCRELSRAKP